MVTGADRRRPPIQQMITAVITQKFDETNAGIIGPAGSDPVAGDSGRSFSRLRVTAYP